MVYSTNLLFGTSTFGPCQNLSRIVKYWYRKGSKMKKLITNIIVLAFGFFMLGTVSSYAQKRTIEKNTDICFRAVIKNDVKTAKKMITEENVNKTNEKGKTLLFVAIKERDRIEKNYKRFKRTDKFWQLVREENRKNYSQVYPNSGKETVLAILSKEENDLLSKNMEIIKHLIDMGASSETGEFNLAKQKDYMEVVTYIEKKQKERKELLNEVNLYKKYNEMKTIKI